MRRLTRLKKYHEQMGIEWVDTKEYKDKTNKLFWYQIDLHKFYCFLQDNQLDELAALTMERIEWENLERQAKYGRRLKRTLLINAKTFEVTYNYHIGDRMTGNVSLVPLNPVIAEALMNLGYEKKVKEHQIRTIFKKEDDGLFFVRAMIELRPLMKERQLEYAKKLQGFFFEVTEKKNWEPS